MSVSASNGREQERPRQRRDIRSGRISAALPPVKCASGFPAQAGRCVGCARCRRAYVPEATLKPLIKLPVMSLQ